MLPIAGQTAVPNGLIFFVDTHGLHVCDKCYIKFDFFSHFFFNSTGKHFILNVYKRGQNSLIDNMTIYIPM